MVLPLKLHQKQALAWMLSKEKSKTKCGMKYNIWLVRFLSTAGILADEMGLGKTLTALALIVANPYKRTLPDMSREEAVAQLNNSLEKTFYNLINKNRAVVSS